jgi:hypothetical protein
METLPPLRAEDLERDFQNPTFSTYVFVGEADDKGWESAKLAFGLIPRLRIYRADRDDRLRDRWLGGGRPKGIAFDWDGNAVVHLTATQARDLGEVVKAIEAARKSQ